MNSRFLQLFSKKTTSPKLPDALWRKIISYVGTIENESKRSSESKDTPTLVQLVSIDFYFHYSLVVKENEFQLQEKYESVKSEFKKRHDKISKLEEELRKSLPLYHAVQKEIQRGCCLEGRAWSKDKILAIALLDLIILGFTIVSIMYTAKSNAMSNEIYRQLPITFPVNSTKSCATLSLHCNQLMSWKNITETCRKLCAEYDHWIGIFLGTVFGDTAGVALFLAISIYSLWRLCSSSDPLREIHMEERMLNLYLADCSSPLQKLAYPFLDERWQSRYIKLHELRDKVDDVPAKKTQLAQLKRNEKAILGLYEKHLRLFGKTLKPIKVKQKEAVINISAQDTSSSLAQPLLPPEEQAEGRQTPGMCVIL